MVREKGLSSSTNNKKFKTKLVAIAKDEAAYLGDWIFHHLDLGFDAVEIWTNNCSDNSNAIVAKISQTDSRVSLVEATGIFESCQKAACNFQLLAYDTAFKSAKATGVFTHMMFLDIDEYLIRRNPDMKISELVSDNAAADILSFIWYSDKPGSTNRRFRSTFGSKTEICRMTQVKSIGKLDSNKISHPLCHNFKSRKAGSEPLNILIGTGILDSTNSLRDRQRTLPARPSEEAANQLEDWFVLHRIYRSEVEYCASLLRGRRHGNIELPLKNNRWGYQIDGKAKEGFSLEYTKDNVRAYRARRKDFLIKHDITKATKHGQRLLVKRFRTLRRMLREDPGLACQFSKQLEGTRFAHPSISHSYANSQQTKRCLEEVAFTIYQKSRFKITMPQEESAFLTDIYLNHATTILEYGTGGSTIFGLAAKKVVIGSETDRDWLDMISDEANKLGLRENFFGCHTDIGPTKSLGYPKKDTADSSHSDAARYTKSTILPWRIAKQEHRSPDVVLIDGRFRAASFITSLALSEPGTLILFDDYVKRRHYKGIEKLLKPEKIVGRMAVFKRPDAIDFLPVFETPMIDYFLDPR